jgi:hypothetical protein
MGKKNIKTSITVKELKTFLNKLPDSFDDFELTNGEYGRVNSRDYYRIDKPIIFLNVDEDTEELCMCHQSEKEIDDISIGEDSDEKNDEENAKENGE